LRYFKLILIIILVYLLGISGWARNLDDINLINLPGNGKINSQYFSPEVEVPSPSIVSIYLNDNLIETRKAFTEKLVFPQMKLKLGKNSIKITVKTAEKQYEKYFTIKREAWFNTERTNMLVAIILLVLLIVYFIFTAQKGKVYYIRKIAGLAALDDAVGRATEMGKAVLYVPGSQDMDDIQTLAGLSILGHVAEKTAEYDTPIMVPTARSLVMSTAQEVVKEAYLKAGRPDAYKSENVRYLTDDQFGYVAGVDGIMVRERTAANFYMGSFYAESLILAETGHSTGAIQIAGTAMSAQLPFFVAACDYTLIGEELFAASAYLSKEPLQVGSLKGQDMGKLFFLIAIIIGVILETFGIKSFTEWFIIK